MSISLDGLSSAMERFQNAAGRIARGNTPPSNGGDTVDFSAEMVAILSARNDIKVNVKTIQVTDEIARSTLDILA